MSSEGTIDTTGTTKVYKCRQCKHPLPTYTALKLHVAGVHPEFYHQVRHWVNLNTDDKLLDAKLIAAEGLSGYREPRT